MKRITFILFACVLCSISWVSAERTMPVLSTDGNGPWYYILVKGKNGDARADRVLMGVQAGESMNNQITVDGSFANQAESSDDVDKQLWRVQKDGDNYSFINKFWDMPMGVEGFDAAEYGTGTAKKAIAVLKDVSNTSWEIVEAPKDPGHWRIKATSLPDGFNDPYLHQGNNAWKFRSIMETEYWSNDPESSYEFVSPDDMIIKALPREVDFGKITPIPDDQESELERTKTVVVTTYTTLTEDIVITQPEDQDVFYVLTGDNWNPRTGGDLIIMYMLDKKGLFEDKAIITAVAGNKKVDIEIPLKGEYYPLPIEPSTQKEEKWYRIMFNQRGGGLMTANGVGEKIIATDAADLTDSQLWKFEEVSGFPYTYRIISFEGLQLDYTTDESERFLSINEFSGCTFSFEMRSDGFWQLRWMEKEQVEDSNGNKHWTYISRNGMGDNEVTARANTTDVGNSLIVYAENQEIVKWESSLPQFSTEKESYWYYIQIDRRAPNVLEIVDQEADYSNIKQNARIQGKESQCWKFVGDMDGFKIVNTTGKVFKVFIYSDIEKENKGRISAVEETPDEEGDYFILEKGPKFLCWQLKNITQEGYYEGQSNVFYVNDFGGTTLCQYLVNDGGNNFNFIPVAWSGVENPINGADKIDDPVIATSYYTLQGIGLGSEMPSAKGIYIKKQIRESKRITAEKISVTGK